MKPIGPKTKKALIEHERKMLALQKIEDENWLLIMNRTRRRPASGGILHCIKDSK